MGKSRNIARISVDESGDIAAGNLDNAVPADGSITDAKLAATLDLSSKTLTYPSGSAAAPSISPAGDTNTGIFFPAADTIAFADGGAEAMRINSSGNVAVGVSSPPTNPRLTLRQAVDDSDGGLFFQSADGTAGGGIAIRNDGGTVFRNGGAEQAKITSDGLFQFNSGYGSSATAYGVRAWVNFNGTGTPAIRASGNVSSITDGGTGNFTVNFTTAMPDANYSVGGLTTRPTADGNNAGFVSFDRNTLPATGSVKIICQNEAATLVDPTIATIQVVR